MTEIVVPGEHLELENNVTLGFGVYEKDGKAYANVMGLKSMSHNTLRVIPLQGRYLPKKDDLVIGIIDCVRFRGCFVDLNSPYSGYVQCDAGEFEVGDVVMVRIDDVNEVNKVYLTDARKLQEGKIVEVSPVKIPRVVGRKGSMLSMIRALSHCTVFVGRNGRIYVKGSSDQVSKVEMVLKLIEKESHTKGLTDRVKGLLEGEKPKQTKAESPRPTKTQKPTPSKTEKPKTTLVEPDKDPLAIFNE